MRYIVKRDYASHIGTYKVGDVLEVDAELGAWLERDSMGGIVPEPVTRAPDAPEHDRMVRKSNKRQVGGPK